MSLVRSPRLCASDDGERCCHYRALLDTPVGDRHPGCLATEQCLKRERQKLVNHMMIWREPIESWNQ